MNTTLLRYFVAYSTYGCSKKAAQELGIDRTSVMRGIKRLENELGTQLIISTPHGTIPTLAGNICLRYAREILRIKQNLNFDLATDECRKGVIHIGINISRSQRLMSETLPILRSQYPNIQVQLHEMENGKEYEVALTDHLLDFAVLRYPVYSPRLQFEEFMLEDYVFVAPKDDPFALENSYQAEGAAYIRLERFRDKPFILCSPAQKSRIMCDMIFKKAGFTPNVVLETHNHLNAALLAQNGFAYTVIPEIYVAFNHNAAALYYRLEPAVDVKARVGIVSLKEMPLSHAAEALKNIIIDVYRTK